MSLAPVLAPVLQLPATENLLLWARKATAPNALQVRGASGSLPAALLTALRRGLDRPVLCIVPDEEAAAYLLSDLEQFGGAGADLIRLPATGAKPYDREQVVDATPFIQRGDVLQQLAAGFRGIIITSGLAVFEKLPPPETVRLETTVLTVGQDRNPDDLLTHLIEQGFVRTEFVAQPGDVAIRGGIVDAFPFTGDYPIRIEFFGDEIDSLREVDPNTQRSVSRLTTARLVPNIEREVPASETPQHRLLHTPLFSFLDPESLLVFFDEAPVIDATNGLFDHAEKEFSRTREEKKRAIEETEEPSARYMSGDELYALTRAFPRLLFGSFTADPPEEVALFESKPQPPFNGGMKALRQGLEVNAARGLTTFILCDSRSQEVRLRELLDLEEDTLATRLIVESLHEGFELPEARIAAFTDHQIFNRYHRPTARKRSKQHGGLTLRDLQNLSPGDFVVHVDYGVGKFAGMEHITVRDRQQEAVRVLFADNDLLYVNVNALHKLHKFSGKEGHQPKLTKLGSGQWERAKARTKKRVKDIARDLLKLYAERKAARGFAFRPDSIWQRELEASFQFEDTPDQAMAAEAVKEDMEQATPMDRLVCGDVGFGKTEVAVRAAFKAVQDGKQVAILVPTTILARQHLETFRKRLDSFPIRIDVVSRFRTTAEQKDTLARLKKGEVDILIGTHRLASKDVHFKDLGLLIIDEEQRFGVAAKEYIRRLRANVDTLTLTATPIPRTLQFSLMGARDLSIINTPPPNRQPIVTEIHTFNRDLVRDAIIYETSRGGQVFFIHNRVQTIDEITAMVRALVPNTRIATAHGQMNPAALEKIMMEFVDGRYDVLVSTNIIESGLDISNANTIIINHAERFGISELHQLRGRVGRSDRKAFCYLLVSSVHGLTREARQRLQAVEEFSELGSGFNIAMRDLDIRGAGSMLGAEQSGFIEDVGIETYHKILDDAVQELRSEEFADLFTAVPTPRADETAVDVDEDAYIPSEYVSNNVERLNLYKRISEAAAISDLMEIKAEISDRFGPTNAATESLFAAAEIKILAESLRLPRITFKNERLFLEMPTTDADPYFYEHVFQPLLGSLTAMERRYVLKESKSKRLRAVIQNVPDLATAREIVEQLTSQKEPA